MKFEWIKVGDQEKCLKQRCYLGQYMLEMVERSWQDERVYMYCHAYVWIPEQHQYMPVKMNNFKHLMKAKEGFANCKNALQEWYELNVVALSMLVTIDE